GGWLAIFAFPPNVAIGSQRDIRVDRVARNGDHRVGVGFFIGARGHAKVAILRIDRVKPSIRSWPHPGDVIAHGPNLPPFEMLRWNHHRKIRFPARTGKGGSDISFFSFGRFHTEYEHVLSEPP